MADILGIAATALGTVAVFYVTATARHRRNIIDTLKNLAFRKPS